MTAILDIELNENFFFNHVKVISVQFRFNLLRFWERNEMDIKYWE